MPQTLLPHDTETLPILRPAMPELDSIRGLAILMVLFYHGYYWQTNLAVFPAIQRAFLLFTWTGRLGVNLFFVLSGFLITGILVDSRPHSQYFKRFYIRRVLRIGPAYLFTILLLLVTGAASAKFLGLSLLYLSNLTPLFGVQIEYGVLWSLAVEEHFYMVWPLVVRTLTNRVLILLAAAIVLVSPLTRLVTYFYEIRQGWVSYQVFDYTWNSLDGLACGAIIGVYLREYPVDRTKFARGLALVASFGLVLLLAGLPFGILDRHIPLGAALQVTPWYLLFSAFLGSVLLIGSGPWRSKVRSAFLEFFGRISYGLYLYHVMFFWLFEWLVKNNYIHKLQIDPFLGLTIRFVVVGAAAVLFSYLSRRFLEEPFLRLKGRWT
jgi:peptidoglycan/LPS O-acetylase OafA/YrhL